MLRLRVVVATIAAAVFVVAFCGGAMKAFMLWVVVGIVREREEKQ